MDGPTPKLASPGGPSASPAGVSLEEAARAASLADHAWGPLDAKGAAAFLKVSEKQFNRMAPSVPRHKKSGMGYRYLRSELLAWLLSGDEPEGPEAGPEGERRQTDGNAESHGVAPGSKKRTNRGKVRLV